MPLALATVLLSAFLLFLVQPMIGKCILPWYGGTAGVWSVCMLFFQSVLLLGYAYAHALIRWFSPRAQGAVHLLMLAGALLLLPITPDPAWRPTGDESPEWSILALLARSVGGPYLILSSTGPLLQAWFARAFPGRSPYPLYAVSNAGSLFALLSYPVLVEPWIATVAQTVAWTATYGLFTLLTGASAVRTLRSLTLTACEEDPAFDPPPPDRATRVMWIALTACATTLLLAVTNQICQEIAVIPFLWVAPLAIYLLSLILVFAGPRFYPRDLLQGFLVFCLFGMTYALHLGNTMSVFGSILVFCGGLFAGCMVLHGEWVRLKPHPRYLTSFYLIGSLGGALGGVFVALIAPRWYRSMYELPIAMVASLLLAALATLIDRSERKRPVRRRLARLALFQGLALVLAGGLWYLYRNSLDGVVATGRNFYGMLKVREVLDPSGPHPMRTLLHGITKHGQQSQDPARRRTPSSYFGDRSGVGRALTLHAPDRPRRIGVVGLGVGTLAAYGKPGDVIRFYEINPLVETFARRWFTYLEDSPARIEVRIGDGRLSLERESPQEFDVLVLDAFSSDSVPVHLLTREAFAIFGRHVRPDGILAVHISNRHLNLRPVVGNLARAFGWQAITIFAGGEKLEGTSTTVWALLTRNREFLEHQDISLFGQSLDNLGDGIPLWTDDYSNLWQILY